MRARLFVDFWNFTLNWRDRAGEARPDWQALPGILREESERILHQAGRATNLTLEETLVYASYETHRDGKLRGWLSNWLDRQPGVRVTYTERVWKRRSVHCRNCDHTIEDCSSCNAPLGRAVEKGIDAKIVTDLLALAWEGAYDVALLLSSDKDFIPAVEYLQNRNFQVINVTWKGNGMELAQKSWANFTLDSLVSRLSRS